MSPARYAFPDDLGSARSGLGPRADRRGGLDRVGRRVVKHSTMSEQCANMISIVGIEPASHDGN